LPTPFSQFIARRCAAQPLPFLDYFQFKFMLLAELIGGFGKLWLKKES